MVAVTRRPDCSKNGQGLDQHIHGLHRPQFPHADDIGGIGPRHCRFKLGLGNAVTHDANHCSRRRDHVAIKLGDVTAFEQKQIGARIENPLQRPVKAAAERAGTINQRAAVRRIGADGVRRGWREPRQCGALGAVAMQHVGRQRADSARNAPQRIDVARVEFARDGNALDAERKPRREFGKHGIGARAAGRRVDDEADAMAAFDLASRHIHHVAEQPAERRAQKMHDLKAGRREGAASRGVRRRAARRRTAPAESSDDRARIAHVRSLNLTAKR